MSQLYLTAPLALLAIAVAGGAVVGCVAYVVERRRASRIVARRNARAMAALTATMAGFAGLVAFILPPVENEWLEFLLVLPLVGAVAYLAALISGKVSQ